MIDKFTNYLVILFSPLYW